MKMKNNILSFTTDANEKIFVKTSSIHHIKSGCFTINEKYLGYIEITSNVNTDTVTFNNKEKHEKSLSLLIKLISYKST